VGGGGKSQRVLAHDLASAGHDVHILSFWPLPPEAEPFTGTEAAAGLAAARFGDLTLHRAPDVDALGDAVRDLGSTLRPDVVVVTSDDRRWTMLSAALDVAPDRTVCIIHTLQQLPFGARAFVQDAHATLLLRRCRRLVAVSQAAADYVSQEAGLTARVIRPHVYRELVGRRRVNSADRVLFVNPSAYKGIDIVLELAAGAPDVGFTAVRGWASTDSDIDRLRALGNVEIRDPQEDVAGLLERGRALLMPSVWDETFGYLSVEAMLLGVPVLAADVGGLREAKLGVPHLLPVRVIEAYRASGQDWRPNCLVPAQDVAPWREALTETLQPTEQARLSRLSVEAAEAFVAALVPGALESLLVEVAGAGEGVR
jgi:glycosyltransferase involved in cell wall biosynthesis